MEVMDKFDNNDHAFHKQWYLSHPDDQEIVDITQDKMKKISPHDLLAINFLYQNYRKNYKGAILNEQIGFNMQLQVSVFLNVMFRCIEQKFLTLIIAPEYLMTKWYQYLTNEGGLKTVVVNSQTCPEEFDDQHGVSLIVSFDDIKLLEHLIDYNFFAIIIDNFDEVAKKPMIKRLCGDFHIGLTTRNFYFEPDNRLQWIMLDWCSPGCCGESRKFCKIDNDNFANFRNNYRHWWFRLTRHFCESLKDIVKQEEPTEFKNRSKIACSKIRKKTTKKTRTSKKVKTDCDNLMETRSTSNVENDTEETKYSDVNSVLNIKKEEMELESTEHTKYSPPISKDDPINLLLPNVDTQDCHMECLSELNKIKSEDTIPSVDPETKNECDNEGKDDILLSLIAENNQEKPFNSSNSENEVFLKKQEISSQIFSELTADSNHLVEKENSDDILLSFLD